jgi:hypothetical protein
MPFRPLPFWICKRFLASLAKHSLKQSYKTDESKQDEDSEIEKQPNVEPTTQQEQKE